MPKRKKTPLSNAKLLVAIPSVVRRLSKVVGVIPDKAIYETEGDYFARANLRLNLMFDFLVAVCEKLESRGMAEEAKAAKPKKRKKATSV